MARFYFSCLIYQLNVSFCLKLNLNLKKSQINDTIVINKSLKIISNTNLIYILRCMS